MECTFCKKNTCLAKRHYYFLRGILTNKMKSSNVDPQKTCFELHTKYIEKVHESKLGHQNYIPIPLCETELIHSLAPDKCGRYTGFWYGDGKMINQIDACELDDNKIFPIHVEILDENTDIFIKKLPNPSAWEVSNLEIWNAIRQLDACFNDMNTFIEIMCYCHDNMAGIHWVNTNKMKFKKSEGGGNKKQCQE